MEKDVDFKDVIEYYMHRVIGLDVPLIDSSTPMCRYEPPLEISLPTSFDTLAEFLGEEFVEQASEETIFSILLGLAYHEAGHALSGEKHNTKPHILNNIICDSNDLNFIPKTFPGAIPFTLTLFEASLKSCEDVARMNLNSNTDKLVGLLSVAITYLRHLKFLYDGKFVRALPDKHPLAEKFEALVPILRRARKAPVEERPELVQKFYEIVKDWWDEKLELTNTLILKPLSGEDAKIIARGMGRKGVSAKAKKELERVRKILKQENTHYHSVRGSEPVRIKEMSSKMPEIDENIVINLRKNLRRMLETRAIARTTPSVKGEKFAPEKFYEVQTRPKKPRVRKETTRVGHKIPESAVCLCFDRSGSMEGEKEKLAIETAATLYCALSGIPQARVIILTFDDEVYLVKDERFEPANAVLRRLPKALEAQNGTNLPKAMKVAIEMLEKIVAHRKILFILTDGDTQGYVPIPELLAEAKKHKIHILCIGILESEKDELESEFGNGKVVYIEDIRELKKEMAKTMERWV